MVKSSFLLFETLLSLIILLVIISEFSHILKANNHNIIYKELELAQNEVILYSHIQTDLQHITFR